MNKIAILMAEGYEESETMLLVDLLRRAELEAITFSMTDDIYVKGMHNVMLKADKMFSHDAVSECDAVFFPGGRPGGPNLIANPEVIKITQELTDALRRNRTIDWQKKESARANMRRTVKRLLKKYKYPPEDMDFALEKVIAQCELWVDEAA